ncbi:MAG: hypothetical protein KA515_02490 [Candidatus Pacebacteria bacterium]|nr:hypothetical protein [Candidatus Paceibacterota bacterium]
MKKILKKGIGLLLLLLMPVTALAFDFRGGEQLSVAKNETIKNDVYMAGGSVNSLGSVIGDLFAGGGQILINGDVENDLFAGGGNVSVLSNVGDDVRVGGGTILVQGKIGGDAIIGGGQVSLGGPGVAGDVLIGGGTVRVDAPISGNLNIGGDNVYINAPIGGNVKIDAGKITLGPSAVISGNLDYKSKQELNKEAGSVVKGKLMFSPRQEKHISPMAVGVVFSGMLLLKFLTLLFCALVVGLSLRRFSKEIVVLATEKPFLEIGRGVVVLATLPIVSILLLVTLVGMPFGVVGLLGFVALMFFAWILSPIILGSYVYRYFSKGELQVSWKTILVGVIIFSILKFIPVIGWLINAFVVLLALGSIIAIKLKILKEWR